MNGANRLFRLLALLGAVAGLLVLGAAGLVIAGTRLAPPSGTAIARACAGWLASGGPAALVGLAVLAAAGAVGVLAVRSIRRQLQAGRDYLASLNLGGERELAGIRYREVKFEQPLAFCAGYLRPRIYLSRGALDHLTRPELAAVLAHEGHHLRRRDPLRRLVARVAADALFFVPALRRMSDRYAALGELAADQAAVQTARDRRPLAAALLKFEEAEAAPEPAAGVDPERVDHLVGAPGAGALRIHRGALATSLISILALGVMSALLSKRIIDPALTPPMLLATGCMLGMFLGPVAAVTVTLVLSRRALGARRS